MLPWRLYLRNGRTTMSKDFFSTGKRTTELSRYQRGALISSCATYTFTDTTHSKLTKLPDVANKNVAYPVRILLKTATGQHTVRYISDLTKLPDVDNQNESKCLWAKNSPLWRSVLAAPESSTVRGGSRSTPASNKFDLTVNFHIQFFVMTAFSVPLLCNPWVRYDYLSWLSRSVVPIERKQAISNFDQFLGLSEEDRFPYIEMVLIQVIQKRFSTCFLINIVKTTNRNAEIKETGNQRQGCI